MYTQGVCIGFVRVEDLSRSARIGNVMVHNSLHWDLENLCLHVYGVERFLQILTKGILSFFL